MEEASHLPSNIASRMRPAGPLPSPAGPNRPCSPRGAGWPGLSQVSHELDRTSPDPGVNAGQLAFSVPACSNWRDRRLLDAGLPGTGSTRLVLVGLVTVELVARPPERVSMTCRR